MNRAYASRPTRSDQMQCALTIEHLFLSPYSQEGQTPKLSDIALRVRQCTQLLNPEPVLVLPGPHLVAQLVAIGVDDVPEAVVRRHDLAMKSFVVAEV
jgi:hypothetical protein